MALSKIDDRGLNTPIDLLDNEKLRLGTGNDLQIYHDGSQSYLVNNTSDLYIQCAGDENAIETNQNGAVKLYYDGTKKFETQSGGVRVYGDLENHNDDFVAKDNCKFLAGNSGDLEIYHDGSNSFIKENGTGVLKISGSAGVYINKYDNTETCAAFLHDAGVELYHDNSKKFETTNTGGTLTGALTITNELNLFNGTTNASRYIDAGLGDSNSLVLRGCSGGDANHETLAQFTRGGAAELYYDNSKKFSTASSGADVTGRLYVSDYIEAADHILLADSKKLQFGAGYDLQIYHDGSNSIINDAGTGSLRIQTDGSNQWEFNGAIFKGNDGRAVVLGDSSDLEIFHSSDTNLFNSKNGMNVKFVNDKDGVNEAMVLMSPNGAVNLYHNGTLAVSTHSQGIAFNDSTDSQQIWFSDSNNDDEGKIVYDHTDDTMRFFVWGSERARFNSSGTSHFSNNTSDTSIYGAADYHTFHSDDSSVVMVMENSHDSSPYGLKIDFDDCSPDNNSNYFIKCRDSTTNRFMVYADGDGWNHDHSWSSSDATLKENIVDVSSKLEDIKKLKVRNFNWKADYYPEKSKKKMIGFIAQEVEEIFPGLVSEHNVSIDDDKPVMKKAIKQAWSPIIIKALQEAIAKIETLETKVAALEAA